MRLKARGLAQRGGPPGWLEESDLASVIGRDGRAVPPALSVPYRLPCQVLPSYELMDFPAAVI
jgi:hypothetical protein